MLNPQGARIDTMIIIDKTHLISSSLGNSTNNKHDACYRFGVFLSNKHVLNSLRNINELFNGEVYLENTKFALHLYSSTVHESIFYLFMISIFQLN